MSYAANDRVTTTSGQVIGYNGQQYNVPAGTEGVVTRGENDGLMVQVSLPEGTVALPMQSMVIAVSDRAEKESLATKAAASVTTDVEADKINDLTGLIAEVKKLRDRVAYLEKVNGINHSEKG